MLVCLIGIQVIYICWRIINSGGGGSESTWQRGVNVKEGRGKEKAERERKCDDTQCTRLNLVHHSTHL